MYRWTLLSLVLASAAPLVACDNADDGPSNEEIAGHDTVKSELARDTDPEVPEEDFETLIDGNHAFTIDMYATLDEDGGTDNLLLSPLSIRVAFGLLQAGARGETETEIHDVLRYGLDQDALHPAFNRLDLALASRNWPGDEDFDPIKLHVANAFWGQTGYAWKTDYLDTIALQYGAGVETLDYQNEPEASRLFINEWVEERTEERIQDLLPEGSIRPDTAAVLTNALYFKAPWALPFDEDLTDTGEFTTLSNQTVQADMMSQSEEFAYTAGEGYEALEMTYHRDELSMVFILPDEGTFENFEASFDQATLDEVLEGLEPAYGKVTIPKFEYESGFTLGDALRSMGMTTAFVSADLSGMIDGGGLFIDEVFHKTFIAVDERGTEAAAATAIVVGETSTPTEEFDFVADHPFLFLIRDRVTGAILFFGRLTDPS
jgi:serpin B